MNREQRRDRGEGLMAQLVKQFIDKQLTNAYKQLGKPTECNKPLQIADPFTTKRVENLRLLEARACKTEHDVQVMVQLQEDAEWNSQFALNHMWSDRKY